MIPLTFSFVINVKAVRNAFDLSSLLVNEVSFGIDLSFSFLDDLLGFLEK